MKVIQKMKYKNNGKKIVEHPLSFTHKIILKEMISHQIIKGKKKSNINNVLNSLVFRIKKDYKNCINELIKWGYVEIYLETNNKDDLKNDSIEVE